MPVPQLQAKGAEIKPPPDICLFAQTEFRSQIRRFGIKTDDRRRHMYVIGKTGMGKTTIMENMVLNDIYAGHGLGLVDPHGDFAEKIINFVPANRINDVVYINPSDTEFPIGFNILEVKNEEQKHLISAGLMGIFKKIWPDVWSSRMEYILNNTLLALLDTPGTTLLGINRMLSDKAYRRKIVRQITDPVVKAFWEIEFANYEDRYAKEAVAPIQNKIGQFLSASVIRNMVAQVKSTINIRELMDTQKIVIMNLSKGRIGEDNSRLLGAMLITKIQLAAMERVDTPEAERKDFFLFVDEFQNFATPSFANILSEARKYRLSLIMAHQYVMQLDEVVADAVFGNVGTIVTFRVGGSDAEVLVKEFTPTFTEEDIVNLPKFHVLMKLMIDGVASHPFSAATLGPLAAATGSAEKVIRVSRERYGRLKAEIEEKIARWSGMEPSDSEDGEDMEDGPAPRKSLYGKQMARPGASQGGGGGERRGSPPSRGGSSPQRSGGQQSNGDRPPRTASLSALPPRPERTDRPAAPMPPKPMASALPTPMPAAAPAPVGGATPSASTGSPVAPAPAFTSTYQPSTASPSVPQSLPPRGNGAPSASFNTVGPDGEIMTKSKKKRNRRRRSQENRELRGGGDAPARTPTMRPVIVAPEPGDMPVLPPATPVTPMPPAAPKPAVPTPPPVEHIPTPPPVVIAPNEVIRFDP